ncbi:DHCW motif cupin fold protein [Pollutibacter soli]|uniref:DHCW motif cupin fold protein n=1 Tax=Pollutibacter soli TaxID=3034157 RepID=UPI003013D9AD
MSSSIPFQTIDWNSVEKTEHPGDAGTSFWQTLQYDGLRIRLVEYGPGYIADHWCRKGHLVYCIEGEFTSLLEDGAEHVLTPGMMYVVSDKMSSHKSMTNTGVKLIIIDGDFLVDK